MVDAIPIRLASGAGGTFGVDDLSCAAATQLGFWAQAGLDVTWIPSRGGVAAMQAVLEGKADAAYGGLGPALGWRAQGKPLRIVVSMARALAQNLVVRKSIADPKSLSGKIWAVDGIGALSHHMARLVVRAVEVDEDTIDWQPIGPPPERIEALLTGKADASLIRVEEAISLSRTRSDAVRTLFGFDQLKRLVPIQPHGVLATTESYEARQPEALRRLARGMIEAARALHDSADTFAKVIARWVKVPLSAAEIETIWRQEHDNGGFAVNGELSAAHWEAQIRLYFDLNPSLARVAADQIIAQGFVAEALATLGRHPAEFDTTGR